MKARTGFRCNSQRAKRPQCHHQGNPAEQLERPERKLASAQRQEPRRSTDAELLYYQFLRLVQAVSA